MEILDWFYSKLSELRDGGLAGAEAKNEILSVGVLEFQSRAIVGSAKVCWIVDLWREYYLTSDFLPFLDSDLRLVNAIQASLNDWLEGGRRRHVYFIWKSCKDTLLEGPPEEPSEASIPSYAVVVSDVILLSLIYQYLMGTMDIVSSKAYSRSSLDFRDIYVAIVLFLGAYVWIKFREVAFKGVHKRVNKRGRITKVVYEPRFKPPRENGTIFQWIYLGQYATPEEAAILYQIAAFYYSEGQGGSLDLEDGRWFSIPPMSEGERSLTGAEKRAWVKVQALKVYEDFRKEKAEAPLLQELLEACEDQATPRQGADHSEASMLNSAEHQLPVLVSQAENSGVAIARLDDHPGLECAAQSIGGMHEGFLTSNGHSLGFQEESALSVSQLTPDTQTGMGMNNSNQLNLLQIVQNQQELITCLKHQLQELGAQVSVMQNKERIQQQQLEESRIHISQLESQHFVQQQLQVINQGVPSFDVEMEQSMPQQNHPCRPRGSGLGEAEAQEALHLSWIIAG